MNRAARVLLTTCAAYIAMEVGVFHTSLYPYLLNPDSRAGYLELRIRNELQRPKDTPNQILGLGDSRMALMTKLADEMNTGYKFGSLGIAATTPRCWYYVLRADDPHANKYSAIVITVDSFDDQDVDDDFADFELDLRTLIARLNLSDLKEYSASYHTPRLQSEVARDLIFKELIYKVDFQDFLQNPMARLRYVELVRQSSWLWNYNYTGSAKSLEGLKVDWATKTLTVAPGTDPELKKALKHIMLDPLPTERGRESTYLKYWLGKIHDRYRTSNTRLVFARVPRAAWIRPDLPPPNPHSSVRELAATDPYVLLFPEDYFNSLERPNFFRDQVHLNEPGVEEFTRLLVSKLVEMLGPLH